MNKKEATLIGFAMRSGSLISGKENCLHSIGKIKLIIFAQDIMENSKKLILNKYQGPYIHLSTSDELGTLIGKEGPRSVLGITDRGFADRLMAEEKRGSEING